MKSPALIFWLALAVVGSAAYGSWVAWRNLEQPAHHHSTETNHIAYRLAPPPGPAIKDFQLVERSGREFDSKDLKGHVWIGSFFFCSCPGPCWQMNQALKNVQEEFKDSDLRLVSITCDPRNDNPEALVRYADRLQADPARWLFLTGDFDYIKRIGRDIFFQPVMEGGHSKSAFVIDRNGRISNSFDLVDPSKLAELKDLVRRLLKEEAHPAEEPGATAEPTDRKSEG